MAQPAKKGKQAIAKPGKSVPLSVKKPTVVSFNGWLWLLAILAVSFVVYFPSLNNKFTNWDDPTYLLENPLIRSLKYENIKRIFTEIYFGNYQPLHIFSYALEYHFYKLNPFGYHATSVVMHLIETGLVCWLIWLLSENLMITMVSALLFGIHPLHVESVAWAAERKDLLYAIFFTASLIAYTKYIKSALKIKYFLFALLLFLLSIMSKTMAASLPPLLILLDIYFKRKFNWKLVLEKVPFFALAVIFGVISVHASSTTESISTNVFTLFQRILIANFNLLAYVVKLLVPIKLSALYPYPENSNINMPFYFYIAPVIVIGILVWVVYSFKKSKVVFFTAGFFVTTIFLVLQLLPVGPAIISERYSYIPSIGFFFLLAHSLYDLTIKKPALKTPVYAVVAAYSIFLSVTTMQRCEVWKDSFSLWTDVTEQFPHSGIALNNLGNVYGKERGQLDIAMEKFNQSITYDPGYENAYVNRGIVFCMQGKFDLGMKDFNTALKLKPSYFDAKYNLALTYAKLNQLDKAITDFTELMKVKPDEILLFINRGIAYSQKGMYDDAIVDLNKSVTMDQSRPEVYYYRAISYYNKKMYKEAYTDIQQASALGYNVNEALPVIKQAYENASK